MRLTGIPRFFYSFFLCKKFYLVHVFPFTRSHVYHSYSSTHQYSHSPSIFITTSIFLSPIIPFSFAFRPPPFCITSFPLSISSHPISLPKLHHSLSLSLSIHTFPAAISYLFYCLISFPFYAPLGRLSLSVLVSVFVIITKIRVSSAIIYFSPPERREISKPSQSRHRGPVLHLGKGEGGL